MNMQTMFECMEMFFNMRQEQERSSDEGKSRKRVRSPSPPPGSEDEQVSSFTPIQIKKEGSKRNKQSGRRASSSYQKGMDSQPLTLCRAGAAIPSAHSAFERAEGQSQTLCWARDPSPFTQQKANVRSTRSATQATSVRSAQSATQARTAKTSV